jgi:hypothetical protein
MASPFRAFRKHQKALLAVAGVVLMFVFVLGGSLGQYLGKHSDGGSIGGQRPGDVAVEWNGGKLTNAQLHQLVVRRLFVNNFIREVEGFGRQAAYQAGTEPQQLRVEPLIGPERPEQGVEQDVVLTYLLAHTARKAGMTISDDYVKNYLQQLGRGYVTMDMLRHLLASTKGGQGVSPNYLFEALGDEMLARNFLKSYFYATRTELPEQRWRDWLKVNDRVVVEAVAVPAESLLIDVPEPTEEELKALYEEYKDREPQPDPSWGIELPSPNPAFAVPRKVAVQYLVADYNQFLAKVEDEVTEEEIKKYYEDNKDYFIKAESVLSEPGDVTAPETTEKKPSNEKPAAEKPTAEGPTDETKPAEPAATKTDAKPDDSPPADKSSAPGAHDESAHPPKTPFRLTAFAEETPADHGEDAHEPDSETAKAQAEAASPAAAPEDVPKPESAVEPETAAGSAAPAEKLKEYQPLDEVRDEIRRRIASDKVTTELDDRMRTVNSDLDQNYDQYFGDSLNAKADGKEPPPPPKSLADLTPLAKKYGLVYQKTEPASMLQLRDMPVGKSVCPSQGNLPFFYAIFSREVDLYQPLLTYDLDNNRYVAMKTEDIPGKVPTFDEVRDDVVHAWKMRKAGELAVKRAEELAKQAQERGGTLAEAFTDDPSLLVTKTDPFSFLTVGTVSRETQQVKSFRLSEPDGIVAAGPDFMEKVFDLKEGEVAAAPNHDRSIAYVVRIAEHQNTPAELQEAFLPEDNNWYGAPAMLQAHFQRAMKVMVEDMSDSAGVHWLRDADKPVKSDAEGDQT